MKILTRLFFISFLLATVLLLSNCSSNEIELDPVLVDITPEPDATEFINEQVDLTLLDSIITAIGWGNNLMTSDTFTFFAPTNEALNEFSIADLSENELTELLNYHLVKGKRYILRDTFTKFLSTNSISEFDVNNTLLIKTEGSIRVNGERKVELQDIRLQNGLIHMMREVATPIDIQSIINAHPDLTTFAQFFEREDVAASVNELLEGDGPFTIFAPTDSAFIDLFAELGINAINGIEANVLAQVLQYHIIPSQNIDSRDLLPSETIATLLDNQNLTVGVSNNTKNVRGNNRTANLIITNGQGSNGIIHLIDKVLLPVE